MPAPFDSNPGPAVKDSDGFGPPKMGGSLAVKHAQVAYTDITAKTLFKLPKNAVIVNIGVNVRTAFNAGTNNNLDIGDGATGNRFVNDLSVASTGRPAVTITPTELFTPLTAPITVTATYQPSGTASSAGLADVWVEYYLKA